MASNFTFGLVVISEVNEILILLAPNGYTCFSFSYYYIIIVQCKALTICELSIANSVVSAHIYIYGMISDCQPAHAAALMSGMLYECKTMFEF